MQPISLSRLSLLLSLVCLVLGCKTASVKTESWKQTLTQELPVLGHRNWIVIADSAYPEQVSAGVETIYTESTQLDAVRDVLAILEKTKHVTPVIHVDSELQHVPESLAPGIEAYREGLDRLLQNKRLVRLPHEELIARLDKAGATFKVIILKTSLTLPYTSVFLELDCGYWGPEQETQLRAVMPQQPQ